MIKGGSRVQLFYMELLTIIVIFFYNFSCFDQNFIVTSFEETGECTNKM